MKRYKLLVFLVLIIVFANPVFARDTARELKKLIGYTIVAADSVSEVVTSNYSDKYVKLYGGRVFKVDFLLLAPLVMTDVIIFAKSLPKKLTEKYKGKLPEHMLYSYKLLIDNKVYDATSQQQIK